jgi:hypothetical protein
MLPCAAAASWWPHLNHPAPESHVFEPPAIKRRQQQCEIEPICEVQVQAAHVLAVKVVRASAVMMLCVIGVLLEMAVWLFRLDRCKQQRVNRGQ